MLRSNLTCFVDGIIIDHNHFNIHIRLRRGGGEATIDGPT
jgi:hypothetical protein